MNYWNMQLHPNDLNWNREVELLKKHSVIGLGDWEEAAKQQPNFENSMQIGDYVMIKHGGNIVALVQVEGDYYKDEEDIDDLLWFQKRRKVKVLDWYNDKYNYSVTSRKTLEKCKNPSTGMYKSIVNWIDRIEKRNGMNIIIKILEANHNLILTGAPGTGKTYLAKQIAQQVIFGEIKVNLNPEEENKFNEQCGFVQFHPSYDYTDFVEGLRPMQDEDGNVGFERKDGVFKAFCKKAIESRIIDGTDNFEEGWKRLVDYLNENQYIEIPLLTGARNICVELNEYGTGLAERLYADGKSVGDGEWVRGHSKFFTKEQLYNIYQGNNGTPSGGHDNYRRAIVKYMIDNKWLKEYKPGHEKSESSRYVFIIDEINRGEISKIFGELFFSIDPGYRGEKGRVQTQYQNIVEDGDIFKKGFYVPENVYIIGTMNDIDRSVESMDFAFRRRFAFKEIKAIDRVEMLYDSNNGIGNYADDAKERMNRLNKEIEKIEGLSTAYHIGPAYFLKLKNYNGDFQQLWNNHLDGLLREYLRGMQNLEEKLKTLKAAYDNESDSDNGQQQE